MGFTQNKRTIHILDLQIRLQFIPFTFRDNLASTLHFTLESRLLEIGPDFGKCQFVILWINSHQLLTFHEPTANRNRIVLMYHLSRYLGSYRHFSGWNDTAKSAHRNRSRFSGKCNGLDDPSRTRLFFRHNLRPGRYQQITHSTSYDKDQEYNQNCASV